jgi:tetratricopeptide (TPR) repeat protein
VPVLEAAVELEPNNAMIWTNLAAAYLGKLPFATAERREKAIVAFQRALALDPHAPNVHYNLGLIHAEAGDLDLARDQFEAALAADPNDRDARHYLEQLACLAAPEDGDLQPA